jgi:hypothetical protein
MGLSREGARFGLLDYFRTTHFEMRFQVRYLLVAFSGGHRSAVTSQVEDAAPNDALDVWRIGAKLCDRGGRKPKNYRAFTKPSAAIHIQRAPPFGVGFIQIGYQNRVARRFI